MHAHITSTRINTIPTQQHDIAIMTNKRNLGVSTQLTQQKKIGAIVKVRRKKNILAIYQEEILP
jgi:hypothetical protein